MLRLVPTPIGNLDDISKRSLDALLEAELIFCEDTRVTKKLLNLLSEKYNLDFSNKEFKSFHSHNEADVLKTISKDTFSKNVVYCSDAGMPCISDPGST
ncbi:rRNA (cytidine-2'-O-)-methyltransferase, partial [Halarcobacter bivalviorum]